MNKAILSIIALAFFVLAIANASATVYEPNYVYDGNTEKALTGVSVSGYICENEECTLNRPLWTTLNTGDNNIIVLTYPTHLMSQYGYQIYFYKPGYFPYKVKADWYGEGRTPDQKDYLYKLETIAFAPIENMQLSKIQVKVNEQVKITAEILSPRINKDNIAFVPEKLKDDYYSDKVKVSLEINGNVVETKSLNMFWSTEDNVEFSYIPTTEGTYTIKIITEITDNKFLSKETRVVEKQLIVTKDQTQPPQDTTAPIITIVSPENKQYTISNIKFEITANEALSNSVVVINSNPVSLNRVTSTRYSETITLDDGSYNVVIYATDIAGNTASKQISFSVKTEDGDNDNGDDDNHKNNARHTVKYVEDEYLKNKYFDQFAKTGYTTIEENKTTIVNDNNYYWLISLILIAIIFDLILLILFLRRR